MTDVFTKKKRSQIMSAIRSKDTRPEKAVRSMLHRMGCRFRLHSKTLPGTPDIVLAKHMTVIEVRGCFFHRHRGCRLASIPKTNKLYWREKFKVNVTRDNANRHMIQKLGWKVIVVWECDLKYTENLERRLRKSLGLTDYRIGPFPCRH